MTCQNNTANGKKEYQCCIPNEKSYVKCDICSATRYIENDIYTEVKQHTQHDMTTRHRDMPAEIQRLQLLERCRKRAAEEPSAESLRRISDTESQSVGNAAASSVK